MHDDPTLLGTVQDVRGVTVSVTLDAETISGFSFINGQAYRLGQIGSFVRIPMGYVDLFGIVSQVGAGAVPERLQDAQPFGNRWLSVQLIGEGTRQGDFQRGISQHPTIDDKVHLVTERDLARIYGRPDAKHVVSVGHLASAESIPALIDVDMLLSRHSAVVGSTGTGKSTTVAGILASLSESVDYPGARIVILDIHGEYAKALADRATIFRVQPDQGRGEEQLCVPYWALTFEELLGVSFGELDDSGRAGVLDEIIQLKRAASTRTPRKGVSELDLTVDTPVPFSIHQAWFALHCAVNATHIEKKGSPQSRETWALDVSDEGEPVQLGDAMKGIPPKFRGIKDDASDPEKIRLSRSPLNIRRQLDSLGSRLRDPRYDFLFKPGKWAPDLTGKPEMDLDKLVEAWIGGEKPITILDLSGIPSLVLIELIGALLRIIYDALFWARNLSEGARERPLLLVLEEAHAYLGHGETNAASIAVRRIAKEGRKYGIGTMIVSQRPSEIDPTILSQCGTMFAMRLSNSIDRSHVSGTASDNLDALFSMLPVLRVGEAIIVGEAVSLPVRTLIDPPTKNRRPDSEDPVVIARGDLTNGYQSPGGWNQPRSAEDYGEVVELWRRQSPRSSLIIGESMERMPVSSSTILSIGYDDGSQTLEVEFKSGAIYQYFDVPSVVYVEFIGAASPGQYLAQNIKSSYRYAKT